MLPRPRCPSQAPSFSCPQTCSCRTEETAQGWAGRLPAPSIRLCPKTLRGSRKSTWNLSEMLGGCYFTKLSRALEVSPSFPRHRCSNARPGQHGRRRETVGDVMGYDILMPCDGVTGHHSPPLISTVEKKPRSALVPTG